MVDSRKDFYLPSFTSDPYSVLFSGEKSIQSLDRPIRLSLIRFSMVWRLRNPTLESEVLPILLEDPHDVSLLGWGGELGYLVGLGHLILVVSLLLRWNMLNFPIAATLPRPAVSSTASQGSSQFKKIYGPVGLCAPYCIIYSQISVNGGIISIR